MQKHGYERNIFNFIVTFLSIRIFLVSNIFLHNGLRKRIPITGRYKRRIEHRNKPGQSTIICR